MTPRTFDVTFGVIDEDQQVIADDLPMWEARLFAIKLCRAEINANEERGNADLARTFNLLIADLRDAGGGGLMDGFVRTYAGADGKQRFLGVLPHGTDYRDARRCPPQVAPSRDSVTNHNGHREMIDPAERIAGEMAKAARKAVA